MANEFIFVYGTLRKGVNSFMSHLLVSHAEYLCEGSIQARLYEVDGYPGAVQSEDPYDTVIGEVYKTGQAATLFQNLDEYEECTINFQTPHEYTRKKITVKLADSTTVSASTYLFNHDVSTLHRIRSGDYLKR
ncbi:MAG: gamma-glutamylcyclotransferase [Geobacteraceae bacterium]|nr:gamma-glutamylcyclotransferase [Geobacteraceae bacterium]